MVDEWQLAPNLWNTVRREIGENPSYAQFIFSGSATPECIDRFLRTLSRNLATASNTAKITREVSTDGRSISESTILGDLDAPRRFFASDPLPAWSADVHSRARIRVAEAIHLAAPP